ncbi:MAG TPA: hypothetical protein VFK94_02310 [Patescibacteria group bacterium]|nr:hypothetical protein [Patescibacteria group bacterium]
MSENNAVSSVPHQDLNSDSPLRTARVHADVHVYSDVDQDRTSQHHTLGNAEFQAAPGNHGKRHLAGIRITGSRGGNAALASVIAALVKLGADDDTTP